MLTHNRLIILTAVALAIAAVIFKTPLASSQGLTITVAAVSGELPAMDPFSELWQQATAVEVPMSAQIVARPISPQANIKSVTARALHNGTDLALMMEWADPTQDESTLAMDAFRDGAAAQFPLAEALPFYCMGQLGGDVNIWHWKADWQAAIAGRQRLEDVFPNMYVDQYPFTEAGVDALSASYTDANYLTAQAAGNLMAADAHISPVENLIAGGFGSLTSQPVERQNVQGYGEWRDGVWRVIYSRSLTSAEPDDVSLASDVVHSVAFAAWDGANDERNGTKSTSQWVSLELASLGVAPAAPAVAETAPAQAGTFRLPGWLWVIMLAGLTVLVLGSAAFYHMGTKRAE